MGIHNNGRKIAAESYNSIKEYLEEHVFVIKDGLIELRKDELEKEKIYNAAKARRILQVQKLERAYSGFEHFRR